MLSSDMPAADVFQTLLRAWKELPRTDHAHVPSKRLLSPATIKSILPHIMILEHIGKGITQYRLVGTKVQEMLGSNPTGKNTGNIDPAIKDHTAFHRAVILGNVACGSGLIATRSVAMDSTFDWRFKTLSLPMSDDEGVVRYFIMGSMLIVPEELRNASKLRQGFLSKSFRFQDTRLLDVTLLDLGGGVPDVLANKPGDVKMPEPVSGDQLSSAVLPENVYTSV